MDQNRGRRHLEGRMVKGEKAFVVIEDWTSSM